MPEIIITHEYPPIPHRGCDWRASFDGREEDEQDGWGATRLAAVLDLYQHCITPEDVLAVMAAAMREDMAEMLGALKVDDGDPVAGIIYDHRRIAYERAIALVEGV